MTKKFVPIFWCDFLTAAIAIKNAHVKLKSGLISQKAYEGLFIKTRNEPYCRYVMTDHIWRDTVDWGEEIEVIEHRGRQIRLSKYGNVIRIDLTRNDKVYDTGWAFTRVIVPPPGTILFPKQKPASKKK